MGLHRQPEHGSRQNCARPQPRTCTHGKSLQTSPCHPTKLPSAPPAPLPTPDRPERPRAPDSERPRVGTKTSRCVEPPSRWSSQIDASVTTASGVDLWTRESGSARSRAYARLRWGLRGSITRSPNGFAPGPSTPSRCIRHAIGIRTDGLWQCRRKQVGSAAGSHERSTSIRAGNMGAHPAAGAAFATWRKRHKARSGAEGGHAPHPDEVQRSASPDSRADARRPASRSPTMDRPRR